MLRRADRALLMAKENGRNQVVQLGSGLDADDGEAGRSDTAAAKNDGVVISRRSSRPSPRKWRSRNCGAFVADHGAQIREDRRQPDPVGYCREFRGPAAATYGSPRHLSSRPAVRRAAGTAGTWRRRCPHAAECCRHVFSLRLHRGSAATAAAPDVAEKAQQVLVSLRSYLMANSEDQEARRRTTRW